MMACLGLIHSLSLIHLLSLTPCSNVSQIVLVLQERFWTLQNPWDRYIGYGKQVNEWCMIFDLTARLVGSRHQPVPVEASS
jgi:hypothetical protein